jgi:competence protein ComFC
MANYCLLCEKQLIESITWGTIFTGDPSYLCEECESKLKRIKGNRCSKCSRSLDKLEAQFIKGEICSDCDRWEKDETWQGILHENISIFEYNDFLKETLATFKYRGDYALAKLFATSIQKVNKTLEYDHIIPIPLSEERLYERGFNQSEALLIEAKIPFHSPLARLHSEKQSKKTRQQRISQKQIFQLDSTGNFHSKNIFLFDDIYTTGATLRLAAKLLKEAGANKVSSFTLARG